MRPGEKWLLFWLAVAYIGFAELLSLITSKFPLCIVISKYQSADDQSGNVTCAPFHEGVARVAVLFGSYLTRDNIIALATAFIALFTLTLWLSTRKLWRTSETQFAHLKDSSERQLRAYVFLDKIDLVQLKIPPLDILRWHIQIAWKNTGRTRTRNLTAFVDYTVLDLNKTSIEDFDFEDTMDNQVFQTLIGPDQSINQPPIPITEVHLVGGMYHDTAFLIWGDVSYWDVFSPQIRRTQFCFQVRVEGNPTGGGRCVIRFEPTEKHNAADEDCMRPIQSAQEG